MLPEACTYRRIPGIDLIGSLTLFPSTMKRGTIKSEAHTTVSAVKERIAAEALFLRGLFAMLYFVCMTILQSLAFQQ